jgi:hypothetical protein
MSCLTKQPSNAHAPYWEDEPECSKGLRLEWGCDNYNGSDMAKQDIKPNTKKFTPDTAEGVEIFAFHPHPRRGRIVVRICGQGGRL